MDLRYERASPLREDLSLEVNEFLPPGDCPASLTEDRLLAAVLEALYIGRDNKALLVS